MWIHRNSFIAKFLALFNGLRRDQSAVVAPEPGRRAARSGCTGAFPALLEQYPELEGAMRLARTNRREYATANDMRVRGIHEAVLQTVSAKNLVSDQYPFILDNEGYEELRVRRRRQQRQRIFEERVQSTTHGNWPQPNVRKSNFSKVPSQWRDLKRWPGPQDHEVPPQLRRRFLDYKIAITLYSHGVSYREIEERLHIAESDIRRTLARCLIPQGTNGIAGWYACVKGFRPKLDSRPRQGERFRNGEVAAAVMDRSKKANHLNVDNTRRADDKK